MLKEKFCFRVTCAYLACKVEEFNVSIQQFVANIKGDREKATEIILNNELLLMQKLNYFLTVHNPMRPIEGFLIDIKVSCPPKVPLVLTQIDRGFGNFVAMILTLEQFSNSP